MKNTLIVSGIVALVVSSLVLFLTPKTNPTQTVGAVSSPDIAAPWFSYGGVRHWAGHSDTLVSATTTVCAIQSPTATSTLVRASINFKIGTTTASTIDIAKATTAFATTTIIGGGALAANAQGTFNATTTPATGTSLDGPMVFAPSTYVVFGMEGGTGTFSPTGTCQAEWVQNSY